MRPSFRFFAPITFLLLINIYGCSTLPSPHIAQPETATLILFNGTMEEAFSIARNAFLANGITPKNGSPSLGFITGKHGMSAFSWGEIVAIYFKEKQKGEIMLWVVSKPKLSTNIMAPDWTNTLLASMQNQIRYLESSRTSEEPSQPDGEKETFRSPPEFKHTGTGFLISPNGIVVTAYHVVDGATNIQVRLSDNVWKKARILKHGRSTDIAILKVDQNTPNYLSLANMKSVKQGQKVFTLGFPVVEALGDNVKYTEGVVSSLSGLQSEDSLMQITVPIQPGNSGGPLINEKGQVVGLITSSVGISSFLKITGTLPQNINWAVKSSYISALLDEASPPLNLHPQQDVVSFARKSVVFLLVE